MIRSCVNKNYNDWDMYINVLMAAYRSTPHPATGFSPNRLMLGREVVLPNQLLFSTPNLNEENTISEYVKELRSKN